MSLSTSAAAVMPAMMSPVMPVVSGNVEMATEFTRPKEIKAEDYQPISDSKNIEKFIKDYFSDMPLMVEIAKCESRYRHVNKNGAVLRGEQNRSDIGVMQVNEFYHGEAAKKMGLNIYDLEDNVAYARYLYEEQGSQPWKSSSPCWNKFSGMDIARK